MSTSVTPLHTCPRCAATVRPGADWCSLCYADLRPAPEPAAAHAGAGAHTGPAVDATAGDQAAAPLGDGPTPARELVPGLGVEGTSRRGKRRRAEPSVDEVEALAAQMVAQLAVEQGGTRLTGLHGFVDSAGKRFGLMVGGGLAVVVLFFALAAVVGALT